MRRSNVPAVPNSRDENDDEQGKKKPYEFKTKKKSKESPYAEAEDEDLEEEDRPRRRKKKRRRARDDDDFDDDRHRSYSPHDGVLNLVLAIVAFVIDWGGFCCLCGFAISPVLAIYVLIKASLSISEIKKGIMDPSGRGLLEVARVIALVSILITIAGVVLEILARTGVITLGLLGDQGGDPFGGPDDGFGGPDDGFGGPDEDF